jgi:ArsR family transcriptional regulator, arsenate/arsenite/antimonite-responsive transcriptional repressor
MKRDKAESYQMELFFRALADRTRLRLLNLMANDEVCVCFLVEALKLTQPKISRHLAYLRRAGIVASRRDGKWMHYRLNQPGDNYAAGVLSAMRDWLMNDPAMQSDRGRLLRLCCSPTLPAPLKKAPKPASIVTAH